MPLEKVRGASQVASMARGLMPIVLHQIYSYLNTRMVRGVFMHQTKQELKTLL